MNKEEIIKSPLEIGRPHVVLLGAGASRAAFPNGDGSGRQIPLMNDLAEIIGLKSAIRQAGEEFDDEKNFETIYSRLISDPEYKNIAREIEQKIEDYFSSLNLPQKATIYDRILLSLRRGDAIFTFNWDPFLFDAYMRNVNIVRLPEIFFLHGNVRIGNCPDHRLWGTRRGKCPICCVPFKRIPLLYPTERKGYSDNSYIKDSWDAARSFFENSLVLTIFGYSAPESDQDAVDLLKKAWFEANDRMIGHIEIIDIIRSDVLYERWKPFSPNLHIHPRGDFDESFIAKWPRRSREAIYIPSIHGEPCEAFPLESTADLRKMQNQIYQIAKWESDNEI